MSKNINARPIVRDAVNFNKLSPKHNFIVARCNEELYVEEVGYFNYGCKSDLIVEFVKL